MSPRTTPTEITTANTTEISNRNSAEAESDSSIDLAIKELVGAVGKGGRQSVMLRGKRSFRLSIELFRYAALLREYMRIETIIKHLLFLLNLSRFLKGLVFACKEDAANATAAANSDFKSSIFILYCFLKFIRNIKSMGEQKKNATHLCDASFNCHIIQNQVLWRYVMRPFARS